MPTNDSTLIGTSGSDTLTGSDGVDLVQGLDGNDTLFGAGGMDTILGGEGSDWIDAGSGQDSVNAGPGNDTVVIGGTQDASSDTADGGDGYDAIEYRYDVSNQSITFLVSETAQQTDPAGGVDTLLNFEETRVVGSWGDDSLIGSSRRDHLSGHVGNDTIHGQGGNDWLNGGWGDDNISAGDGDDFISTSTGSQDGNDTIDGGDGDDALEYWFGDRSNPVTFESKWTGSGPYSQPGPDGDADQVTGIERVQIIGGGGADRLIGDPGNNFLRGEAGDDTLTGGGGSNTFGFDLNGPQGVDLITDFGANLNNRLEFYNAGLTTLSMGGDPAALVRGQATVVFTSATEASLYVGLDSTPGSDFQVRLQGVSQATGTFALQFFGHAQGVVYAASQTLVGTEGDDNLTGGAAADSISGLGGRDGVYGQEGNDTLLGGTGNDHVDGGPGDDSVDGGDGDDYLVVGGSYDGGSDTVDGGPGYDTVAYDYNHGGFNQSITFTVPELPASPATPLLFVDPASGKTDTLINIERFQVNAGGGNDTINGSSRDDGLQGGWGDDVIYGNAGNDWINGVNGSDLLIGGAGDDYVVNGAVGPDGNDTIDGGEGHDVLEYGFGGRSDGVVFESKWTGSGNYSQPGPDGDVDQVSGIEKVYLIGGGGSDRLIGDPGDNFLRGEGGNDTLAGGGGSNTFGFDLNWPQGVDLITDFGASLNNRLEFYNAGITTLSMGGDPAALGRGQATVVFTSATEASLYVGLDSTPGSDFQVRLQGVSQATGTFALQFFGHGQGVVYAGPQTLIGTEGNDTLSGGAAADSISGLGGNDQLNGNEGDDTLVGGAGNDNLNGGDGHDSLTGEAGGDYLVGGPGNDTIDGGAVTDRVNYVDGNSLAYWSSPSPVNVNLATGVASDGFGGTDQVSNIQFLYGSNGADILTGSSALYFEMFEGGPGDDTIDGGPITDTVNLYNFNRANYNNAPSAVTVNLATGRATGGHGNDTLININQVRGSAHADVLTGSDRTDFREAFEGRAGNDTINGAGGEDQARYENAPASVNVNLATGTAADGYGTTDALFNIEAVVGSGYADTIIGSADGNRLEGRGGDDSIFGDAGSDTLTGGGGNDTLDGGSQQVLTSWADKTSQVDLASYTDASGGVQVNLSPDGLQGSATGAGVGTDELRDIEMVLGSNFDDTLVGSDRDLLEIFRGGTGNDSIDGRAGTQDLVDYRFLGGAVQVDLATGRSAGAGGVDTLTGVEGVLASDFDDVLTGDSGDNGFEGNRGNDTIDGGAGTDSAVYSRGTSGVTVDLAAGTSSGSEGNDQLISIENVRGSEFADVLLGSAIGNVIQARAGHDSIDGREGNDTLHGGYGNDTLLGGAGDDQIEGGSDTDVAIYQGARSDYTLTVDYATGRITVMDSVNGRDGSDTLDGVEFVQFANQREYVLSPAGYLLVPLSPGDDTIDFTRVTGWSNAQLEWPGADRATNQGAVVNLSTQNLTAGAVTLSPYQLRDPYGSVDTLVTGGQNSPPDLTFWSGPTDDYLTAQGNSQTSFIWNMRRGAGHDTVVGGNALSTIDFFIDDALSFELTGQHGLINVDANTSVDYTNVNRWRLWNGDFTVKASANAEQFEIWANSVNLDLSSGGADWIHFTGWKSGTVRITGLSSDDFLAFNVNEFGPLTQASQLNLSYDPVAGVTRFALQTTSGRQANVELVGHYEADQFRYTPSNTYWNDVSFRLVHSINTIVGTNGNDNLVGTAGADSINGGQLGNDTLSGGPGNDSLFGGKGSDWLIGSEGVDYIDGGEDADVVFFEDGNQGAIVNLQTGVVTNDGFGNAETVVNVENLHGTSFADHLTMGAGNTYVFARAGNDTVIGSAGNNNFFGGSGNDSLDGADGIDTANYFDNGYDAAGPATRGVLVNLSSGTATDNWGGQDTLLNFENVSGSILGDDITGNGSGNSLNGDAGNDTLSGGGGNDSLNGGDGVDTAMFSGNRADYDIFTSSAGLTTVVDKTASRDGTDQLMGVERLQFADKLIDFTAPNQLPVAAGFTVTTTEDSAVSGALPAATDADGDLILYAQSRGPSYGTLTVTSSGAFTYTPGLNYHGSDSFEFSVSDGRGGVSTYTANVTVTPVNDAPLLARDQPGLFLMGANPGAGEAYLWGRLPALLPDGSVVVVGNVQKEAAGGTANRDLLLVKLGSDGQLDPTFGVGGRSVLNLGLASEDVRDVAVQTDGRLLVAVFGNVMFSVARVDNSGSLDTTFGNGGVVAQRMVPNSRLERTEGVAVESDGQIVLSGRVLPSNNLGQQDFGVVRLNANGALDTNFAQSGVAVIPVGTSGDTGRELVIQPDGRIVVGGFYSYVNDLGSASGLAAVRLLADGSLDSSFGNGGKALLPAALGNSFDAGYGIALQADGKILLSGTAQSATDPYSGPGLVVRLLQNGALDTSFGVGGVVRFDMAGASTVLYTPSVRPDGKIIVPGFLQKEAETAVLAVQLNPDGSFDTEFSGDGWVTVQTGDLSGQSYGGVLQSDGRFVLAGVFGGGRLLGAARLNVDGSLDTSFNPPLVYGIGGPATPLADVLLVRDPDLEWLQPAGVSDYGGASITLKRAGGAVASDSFVSISYDLVLGDIAAPSSEARLNGQPIGTVTRQPGELKLTFAAGVSQATLNQVLAKLGYANTSPSLSGSVHLEFIFDDGNAGVQGAGGAQQVSTTFTLITAQMNQILGTEGNDSLAGTPQADQILGLGGQDTIAGSPGRDLIDGGLGADVLVLDYSSATTPVVGLQLANTQIDFGGTPAMVDLMGPFGLQQVGGIESFQLTLTAGADVVTVTGTNDTVDAGAGDDFVDVGGGDDVLRGGTGNDSLYGSNGRDTVYGDAGNDTLGGGEGNDTLDGGEGYDRARFGPNDGQSNASGYTLNLSNSAWGSASFTVTDANGQTDTLISIEAAVAEGSGYADRLTLSPGDDSAWGSGGNDSIFGGRGADTLRGEDGDDYLDGGPGADVVFGGAGDDYLFAGGSDIGIALTDDGADTIDGGDGYDWAVYHYSLQGLSQSIAFNATEFGPNAVAEFVQYDPVSGKSDVLRNIEGLVVHGGEGNDTLTGASRSDNFIGNLGNDVLYGMAGDDGLNGGAGNDTVIGGPGNDSFNKGGDGSDSVDGGDGFDTYFINLEWSPVGITFQSAWTGAGVYVQPISAAFTDTISGVEAIDIGGSPFDDRLTGDIGNNNAIAGYGGNDTIDGAGGFDIVRFRGAKADYDITFGTNGVITVADKVAGRDGTDQITNAERLQFSDQAVDVQQAFNLIVGTEGNDSLVGTAQADSIQGLGGNDTLRGGQGSDAIDAGAGDDLIIPGSGADSIAGGSGFDIVSYSPRDRVEADGPTGTSAQAVTVNLRTGQATDPWGQLDTLSGVELVWGTEGNDSLVGGDPASGSQQTDGFEGFRGEEGNDTIDGGTGFDRAYYDNSPQAVAVQLGGTGTGTAQDGWGGSDTLISVEEVRGSAFNDTLTGTDDGYYESFEGRAGNDLIDGKGGTDRVNYQTSPAGVTVNLSNGTASDGWGGNDTLSGIEQVRGSDFADTLVGDSNNNFFDARSGDDSVTAGAGNDTVQGAGGNDLLSGGEGQDSLVGQDGNDTVQGDAGNDTLDGGAGDDSLLGGAGNDVFFGRIGSDVLDGGEQRRVPWLVSTSGDYDRLDYSGTQGIQVNLGTRTVQVTGEQGTDTYSGIEEIHGGINAKDTVTGRVSSSAADAANGAAMYLYLRGGSDEVNQTGYGNQQTWADGVYVAYHWSATGVQLTMTGNTATVSYGASGSQQAGQDTLVNVGIFGDSTKDDTFDFSQATVNQLGYVSDARTGKSWHTVLMGRGGSDTVIGNGLTGVHFGAVDATGNGAGLVMDLRAPTANLSNLSSAGVALGTLTFSGVRSVTGTRFNDTMLGGVSANDPFETFRGDGGDDSIDGGSGFDRADYRWSLEGVTAHLAAGTVSSASSGNDTLRAVEGLRGSMFDDAIDARGYWGGAASTTANVSSFWWGYNEINPEGGNDTIQGNGNTALNYEAVMVPVRVNLAEGVADARLEADKSTPQYLTMGRDTFSGVSEVRGSQYDDLLMGGGAGRVGVGSAHEVFNGGAGNDTIDGLSGWDYASYAGSPSAIVADLSTGTVQDGWGFVDSLVNIEALTGSFFADSLRGSAGEELFSGRGGADTIDGGAGYDEIEFVYDYLSSGVTVRLDGWVGASGALPAGYTGSARDQWGDIDLLKSIEGVEGSNYNDLLVGDAGDNRLDGRGGNDTIDGGAGTDWVEYNQATSGVVVNLGLGVATDDGQGLGSAARDSVAESDSLSNIENVLGGMGNDSITGDSGANVLEGGIGNDTLDGGAGTDTARFTGVKDDYTITVGAGGVVTVTDKTTNRDSTDTLTNIEKLQFSDQTIDAPTAATPALQGIAYHWKSHAVLPGVTVTVAPGAAVQATPSDLFDLRGASFNSSTGVLSVEVWVNPGAASVGNFEFLASANGATAAEFISVLPESWNLTPNTENPQAVRFAGISTTGVSVATQLGQLRLTLPAGTTNAQVSFGDIEVGSVAVSGQTLTMQVSTTGADGGYTFTTAPADPRMTASRAVGDGSANSGISSADALAALRIAVGLNPNPDPDGTGPKTAPAVSPYQIMAADVNGNGTVTSADALAILRMAVRLSTALPQEWFFVEEKRDFWDEVNQKFTLSRLNSTWDRTITADPAGGPVNLVGVLKGDVNGSWAAPAGFQDLDVTDPTYFQRLAELIGVPNQDQWGGPPPGP